MNIDDFENMVEKMKDLLKQAKKIKMTPEQRENQRRSFVFGTIKLTNKYVTEEMVNNIVEELNK